MAEKPQRHFRTDRPKPHFRSTHIPILPSIQRAREDGFLRRLLLRVFGMLAREGLFRVDVAFVARLFGFWKSNCSAAVRVEDVLDEPILLVWW
jgi:hypothetical protein